MSSWQNTHPCPVRRCGTTVSFRMLMCPGHWKLVPRELRDPIYDALLRGDGQGSPAHMAAIDAAIRHVNDGLAEAR